MTSLVVGCHARALWPNGASYAYSYYGTLIGNPASGIQWYNFRPPGVTHNRGIAPPWGAFCQITLTSCFPYQTVWKYSDRGVECRWGMKKSLFSTSITCRVLSTLRPLGVIDTVPPDRDKLVTPISKRRSLNHKRRFLCIKFNTKFRRIFVTNTKQLTHYDRTAHLSLSRDERIRLPSRSTATSGCKFIRWSI